MRMMIIAFLSCLLAWPASARDLVVFAAASLKEPLDALAAQMGDTVVSYGGSGTLARQIMAGAPADIVILAHPQWMDVLEQGGQLASDTRVDLLGNRLVLAATTGTPVPLTVEGVTTALGDGRLAIGLTEAVPAGIYGKAALHRLGLWDAVSGKLAETDNVRAALALVARAEVPLGLVYATDVRVVPELHTVAEFPTESHPDIRYVAAVVHMKNNPQASEFMSLMRSNEGRNAFVSAGFLPLAGAMD